MIRQNTDIFAVDISGVGGSRSTDPKDIENEVKTVFEDSIGKEEAELVTKGIAQVSAETANPSVQSTSGSQSTTPPANQSTTQSTTSSTSNTTQSSGSKQSNFTPVNADDDFLRGFNSDYTDECPQFSTPITRASLWDDSRKELSHKGIMETAADPGSYKYTTGYDPLFDDSSRNPEVRALREKGIQPIYDPFLEGFNSDYTDERSKSSASQITRSSTWEESQKELNNRGIIPVAMDFGENKKYLWFDPVWERKQRELSEKGIAPETEKFEYESNAEVASSSYNVDNAKGTGFGSRQGNDFRTERGGGFGGNSRGGGSRADRSGGFGGNRGDGGFGSAEMVLGLTGLSETVHNAVDQTKEQLCRRRSETSSCR